MQRIATIPAIIEQHVEDAAFLWHRRSREIDGPIMGAFDIGRIDQRLDANLDGLFAAGQTAWDLASARFADYQEPPELFLLGALAFEWQSASAIKFALESAGRLGKSGLSALSGSVARSSPGKLKPFVARWLDSTVAMERALGVGALHHHGGNPGPRLTGLLSDGDAEVRRRALKLAGALRRRDVIAKVWVCLEAPSAEERLEAAVAACLLGEAPRVHPMLDKMVARNPELAGAVFEIRLLTTPSTAARTWWEHFVSTAATREAAVAASGLAGDMAIMPWLIERMRSPELAYAAGLALRDLIEIDFNDTDVFVTDPAKLGPKFEIIEATPLPCASRVQTWWDNGRGPAKFGKFQSMRRLRLDAMRGALANAEIALTNWRRSRSIPAWM
ncbi:MULTISPECIES: hypothetical protein [unclassified Mesorhizobium]|uniref:hypothetical protein n=1 Tax=unclassified Mesorhizobium TaxID=325217 RepID=UPI00112BB804|nr:MULTISPECIES: hypothetical protein [unclassified Mesorhizobium]TPJ43883.1 hypothetical protein FJ437_19575 [Mesorhizobium sp. B2-6-6]MCA0002212.1 hypothetical protein [Mesorhizobium sp. B264B2A]MCA0008913.1 hypothetical protein [Mesorhizobium sp. B264B1B]MCA0017090.1 hypothetical protein [Mesorhizobium sp. B264B1A]TPJ56572.1 hypothetical protein FJ462_32710 [Mesorhizobium sp. B2-6-7]